MFEKKEKEEGIKRLMLLVRECLLRG
jgi:hypothetical protein